MAYATPACHGDVRFVSDSDLGPRTLDRNAGSARTSIRKPHSMSWQTRDALVAFGVYTLGFIILCVVLVVFWHIEIPSLRRLW